MFVVQFDSSLIGQNDSTDLEQERRRSAQLENELISLKIKYDDVCERVTAATLQLERVQVVLEQTLRRCEQLEKEKVSKRFLLVFLVRSFHSLSLVHRYFHNIFSSISRLVQLRKKLVFHFCCCCFHSCCLMIHSHMIQLDTKKKTHTHNPYIFVHSHYARIHVYIHSRQPIQHEHHRVYCITTQHRFFIIKDLYPHI